MVNALYPVSSKLVTNKSIITISDILKFIPSEEDIDIKYNKFYKWNDHKLQPSQFIVDKPALYNNGNFECWKIYGNSSNNISHSFEITITDTVRVDKVGNDIHIFNRF